MIKIVEHGYRKYRTTCHSCRCYFEYEITDVSAEETVACPECGKQCYHDASLNAMITSQFSDDREEVTE